jgi:hypothetical protein
VFEPPLGKLLLTASRLLDVLSALNKSAPAGRILINYYSRNGVLKPVEGVKVCLKSEENRDFSRGRESKFIISHHDWSLYLKQTVL